MIHARHAGWYTCMHVRAIVAVHRMIQCAVPENMTEGVGAQERPSILENDFFGAPPMSSRHHY